MKLFELLVLNPGLNCNNLYEGQGICMGPTGACACGVRGGAGLVMMAQMYGAPQVKNLVCQSTLRIPQLQESGLGYAERRWVGSCFASRLSTVSYGAAEPVAAAAVFASNRTPTCTWLSWLWP